MFAIGSVDHLLAVKSTRGSARRVCDFYRFLASGLQHCSGGPGASRTNLLAALVEWGDRGVMPNTLVAAGPNGTTSELCRFPTKLMYTGTGNTKVASSWTCI